MSVLFPDIRYHLRELLQGIVLPMRVPDLIDILAAIILKDQRSRGVSRLRRVLDERRLKLRQYGAWNAYAVYHVNDRGMAGDYV
jgi:hypothetical protein